nr:ATP-dependent Zn protease [Chelativorans petroleitrophicus]
MTGDQGAETILRALARRASGLSGADIERLVREARQVARRERRPLSWDDLTRRLGSLKPPLPENLRWRAAVHEAGHAVAGMVLGLGEIVLVTIDAPDGGMVVYEETPAEETEEHLNARLVAHLAGRAAEEVILGSCSAGSGGDHRSDLAAATQLALNMETAFGFGADKPLLHLNSGKHEAALVYRRDIAERVNRRLESAYGEAREIVREHGQTVERLASLLSCRRFLERQELERLCEGLRSASHFRKMSDR